MTQSLSSAQLKWQAADRTVYCGGDWSAHGVDKITASWQKIAWPQKTTISLDGSAVKKLDTAGAWILYKIIQHLKEQACEINLINFQKEQQLLIAFIQDKKPEVDPHSKPESKPLLYRFGKAVVERAVLAKDFLAFIGELCTMTWRSLKQPRRVQWNLVLKSIETTGYNAVPIIALLSFLIGVVLGYQMGLQLQVYGATIYVADLLGVAILREFGPLITAIIVAGRTGSAFTAEIGTMKVNQEVDALRTMGLSAVEFLVIPKFFAMLIVMPLLILLADMMGILGGMMMAKTLFGLEFTTFLKRFHEVISLNNYVFGLIKAPAFAMIIASVGCFQGFRVGGSADSVGKQTTVSVVQAIFLIIIADAFFSIVYGMGGV